MTKAQLLDMIQTARAHWDALLAGIPEAWMTEPGVAGEWSIKDIIAHIAWGERENLGVAQSLAVVGSELWRLSEDERNAAVFEQNRDRELGDVLAESRQTFRLYLDAVAALSEEDLNDPSQFAEMPEGWRPWRILFDPGHYQEHADGIRTWLARQARDS
ncbi:MAG TPA: DinB family protein [Ktedonobacterales bacterium]|nr:DinB family protein [Ktedonobacterales bacterium]